MALTETWLNETDGDNYNIKGYNFLQRKRKHKNGGGIALYIKEDIKVKIRNYINDEINFRMQVELKNLLKRSLGFHTKIATKAHLSSMTAP